MATTDYKTDTEPAVSSLVGGIVEDARQLLVEQMTLFQVEIKNDVHRAVTGVIPLVMGILVAFVGLLVLAIGAAHFVCWLFPDMPTWGGFAAVGGTIAVIAAGLIFWAKSILVTLSPLPDTAIKGLKENLQWKTKN